MYMDEEIVKSGPESKWPYLKRVSRFPKPLLRIYIMHKA